MPNKQYGHTPIGPEEGQYDVRRGAAAYSSIIASIGSLAVTAIVVIFTVPPNSVPDASIALATGLLAIAFMGSILGAFAFAAIGAENDPTANIGSAVLYASLPVSIAIVGTFGAFEVLASIYVPESVKLFATMTGVAGFFCVLFTAASIPDSLGLHPTTMTRDNYHAWRKRQWLQDRSQALRAMWAVVLACGVPIGLAIALRVQIGRLLKLDTAGANWVVLLGVALVLIGALKSFVTHPKVGNEQVSLGVSSAWVPNVLIAFFTCLLLLTLP